MVGKGKLLTKEYRTLLYSIGSSPNPVSSTELEKKLGSKYSYEMINKLCPNRLNQFFLFEWSKEYLDSNIRNITQKMNLLFNSKLKIMKTSNIKYDRKNENLRYKLNENGDRKELLIFDVDPTSKAVKINLRKNDPVAILSVINNGNEGRERPLNVVSRGSKILIYVEIINMKFLASKPYLDIKLRENVVKEIESYEQLFYNDKMLTKYSEKKNIGKYELKEAIKEHINDIRKDKSSRRYILNFRGFLLYVYLEFNLERPDVRRIKRVISNPLVIKSLPFLDSWKFFERNGFNVIKELKKIATIFKDQLEADDFYSIIDAKKDDKLDPKIMEIYFNDIYRFFEQIPSRRMVMNAESRIIIQKFYLNMLNSMENLLEAQVKTIKMLRRFHSESS